MIRVLMVVAAIAGGGRDTVPSGADVVRAMHERYADRWYRTLALVQVVNYYDLESGAIDSARVWYESIQLPGTVRSDIAPLDAGNSISYLGGQWTEHRSDTLVRSRPGPHPVLLLGFDVYIQPPDETLSELRRVGFDPSRLREAMWQGRQAWVVGSVGPHDRVPEFWVDQEDLLLRRLVLRRPGSDRVREVRLDAYEPLGGGWIATELTFLRDGRPDMREQYQWFDFGMEFDPAIFAESGRARPDWIRN